jgi:phosphoadenosine phosphosulfate reductase
LDYRKASVGIFELSLPEIFRGRVLTQFFRDQGGERNKLPIVEIDAVDGRIKINPLANWSGSQVWNYLKLNGVMWNPLHDQGYRSIGDKMTTKPVSNDEGERSGRFYQIPEKTECGIHNRPKNWKKTLAASAPPAPNSQHVSCKA